MIRINLLGQIRPRAARRPVDTGAAMPAVFIGAGLLLGALVLGFFYYTWQNQLNKENAEIKRLTAQKTELEQTKQQVELFEKQKDLLQRRVSTIEQLQRDRTGGQELLDMVAQSVSRHVRHHASASGCGGRRCAGSGGCLRARLSDRPGT